MQIKSNRPELYLVKPMEGSIYNSEKVRVVFTRKELSKVDFERHLKNPNQNPEKFLVEFSYLKKDAIGRETTETQSSLIVVNFRLAGADHSKISSASKSKQEEEMSQLHQELDGKVYLPLSRNNSSEFSPRKRKSCCLPWKPGSRISSKWRTSSFWPVWHFWSDLVYDYFCAFNIYLNPRKSGLAGRCCFINSERGL